LVGWYRDCGIIPHTTDFDIGILSDQYDRSIIEKFLGYENFYIHTILGRVLSIIFCFLIFYL
jgi:hypothetical protein